MGALHDALNQLIGRSWIVALVTGQLGNIGSGELPPYLRGDFVGATGQPAGLVKIALTLSQIRKEVASFRQVECEVHRLEKVDGGRKKALCLL